MTLKEQILTLRKDKLTHREIAEKLNCGLSTVGYHLCPKTRQGAINRGKIRRKKLQALPKPVHPLIKKEIQISIQKVDWKHAETFCIAELTKLKYEVFLPVISNGEIDFIAYKDNKTYRIQVKAVSPKNKYFLPCTLVRKTSNGSNCVKNIAYTNIDWFLIYDGTNIYKINRNEINGSINLRYKVPAPNNNGKKVHMASDYILKK